MKKIALLGFGVVGRGVYDIIAQRDDLEVVRVLVRRQIPEIAAIATADINDIVSDPSIDTVVEVGRPRELKRSSRNTSLITTARNMHITSLK